MKELLVFFNIILAVQLQPDERKRRCVDGDVRLSGGPNEFEGRVELCEGGSWVQVCGNDDWGPIPGNVVCNHTANYKRIGFYLEARVSSGYYSAKDIAMDFVNVVHNKCIPRGNLSSCVSKVQNQGCENQFASAACPATCIAQSVRLTPSVGNQDGLVEICLERADDTFWTGVCKEDMTLAAATVICRQLGFLHANSSVNISSLPTRHRYTYKTVKCVGNESNLTDCELNNVQTEDRCSAATVNCQSTVVFDCDLTQSEAISTQGGVTQKCTTHEQTSVAESIVTEGTASSSGPDMLAVITGALCGFIVLLLLIIVVTLTLILFTKSRNRIRLKDTVRVPVTVDGLQPFNFVNSRGVTTNQFSTKISSSQVSSQNGSLTKDTVDNTTYQSQYSELRQIPMVPIDNRTYNILNVPQVNLNRTFLQSHTFRVQDGDPDFHIYAEPCNPIKDSCGQHLHVYAELEESGCSYQNDIQATPFPYELPLATGRSTKQVHSISTQGVDVDGARTGPGTATSRGIANADEYHQYAELTEGHLEYAITD